MNIDRQRSAVYQWENIHVAPHDTTIIPFDNIKAIVDWLWQQEGLKFPPLVEPMPKQKHALGDATRTIIRFKPTSYTWIVLHEVSHSMTASATIDHRYSIGNKHGSLFMGVYIQLLSRYLKLPFGALAASAEANGLHFKLDARPIFL